MAQEELMKPVGDIAAAAITVGIFLKFISAIAGLFTIVWTGMRIWEMVTGRMFYTSRLARFLTKRNDP